jgi:glycine cleavage system H lipoate-binding protein
MREETMIGSAGSREARELPCVWSLAGVLEMRPCDRGYDCDSCELFHALSGHRCAVRNAAVRHPVVSERERAMEADVGRIVSRVMSGCRLDLDRWYGRDGLWVAGAGAETLDVGLVGCVWRVLEPVREIVPPRAGLSLDRGETCGWLVRSDRSIPLRLPLPGRILEVNDDLVARVCASGTVDGPEEWLFRLRSELDPASDESLFQGEEALVWHLRKLRALKGAVREALESGVEAELGPVLADGGVPARHLEQVLGPDRYRALLDHLF